MTTPQDLDSLKKAAALKAVEFVRDGMVVGLGTGSTARHVVSALGERVRTGMTLRGVPTSQETAMLARQAGITLIDSDNRWAIDVAIDGADQVVDETKRVPVLGGSFPLPIEIIPFGWGSTAREIETLTGSRVVLRERNGAPFKTEAGNMIVDVHLARIEQPADMEIALNQIPGVVETGLFVGRTDVLIVGTTAGTETHLAKRT